jgi:purine nucleosidase
LRATQRITVTLCPLTNIATAFLKAPDIALHMPDIVLMPGTCFEAGTIPPAAGFNICVAPESAQIVFASGLPLVAMPLDVPHKAQTPRARVKEMRRSGTPVHQAVASPTDIFERFDTARYDSNGTPLHDPFVIASLLQPDLIHARHISMRRLRPIEFLLAGCGDVMKRRAFGSSSGTTRRGPYAPSACCV